MSERFVLPDSGLTKLPFMKVGQTAVVLPGDLLLDIRNDVLTGREVLSTIIDLLQGVIRQHGHKHLPLVGGRDAIAVRVAHVEPFADVGIKGLLVGALWKSKEGPHPLVLDLLRTALMIPVKGAPKLKHVAFLPCKATIGADGACCQS